MDRQIVYPGAIPLETDLLNTNKQAMIGLGKLAAAMLGTTTRVNGLTCTPTTPASMQVQVEPGEIYSLQNIDGTAYSSLAADTTHPLLKQGLLLDTIYLDCPAPATSGYSLNYLVQAAYQDVDANPTVLPYYNASNPSQAYSGPNNNGSQNYTTRKGLCTVAVKAGIAAATGTQQAPAADSGYVGLWVVAVAYGQTQTTAQHITRYDAAPRLPSSLLHAVIDGNLTYGTDHGAANLIQAAFPLPITALADNIALWVEIKANNTGATTFTPNPGTIAAAPVVGLAHTALQGGELAAGGRALFVYRADLTSWVLVECTGGAQQVAPATQSQHALTLGQASALLGETKEAFAAINGSSAKTFDVANATAIQHALPLGQANGAFAAINGSNAKTFDVAPATAAQHAVPLSQVNDTFAAVGGNGAKVFNVANATEGQHALPLGQANAAFAPIAGNSTKTFDVAPATAAQHAIQLGQVQTLLQQGMSSAGQIVLSATGNPLPNTLVCNGAAVSRETYAKLFTAIGAKYGAGDGSTTFNLPNAQEGMALLFGAAGTVGQVVNGAVISHSHGVSDPGHSHGVNDPGHAHGYGGHVTGDRFQYSGGGGNAGIGIPSAAGANTNASGTGITINGSGTGLSIQAAGGSVNAAWGMKLLACITY